MKSLTSQYKDHVALKGASTLCSIILIERKDGTQYSFTDFDSNIEVDSILYKYSNSFIPTDFQSAATLAVDNLDITGIVSEIDDIQEGDIYREFFYDAKIWVSRVNYNAPEDGREKILYGSLGEMTLQENIYTVEFRNLTYILTKNLANIFSKTCRVELGSAKCGVLLDPLDWVGNTEYCVGDFVSALSYDGRRYECTTAGTSDNIVLGDYQSVVASTSGVAHQWSLNEDSNYSSVSILLHGDGTDGSTTFTDSSTNGFTPSSVFGQTQIDTADKKYGTGSILFDGASDYIWYTSNVAFGLGTGPWTVECYAKTTTLATNNTLFDFRTTTGEGTFYIQTNGKIAYWNDTTNYQETIGGAGTISINTWYHIAFTYTSGVLRGFLDGTLFMEHTGLSLDFGASKPFFIGSHYNGATDFFTGWIDEIRVTKGIARYTSSFTPLYLPFADTSTAKDTVGSNNGTLINTPTLDTPSIVYDGGTAYTFTRANSEYISIPAAAAINNFFSAGGRSVEAWIKPTTVAGDGANSGWIIAKDDSTGIYGTGYTGWGLNFQGDNNRLSFFQRFDDGVSTTSVMSYRTPTSSIPDDTISHIVVTYDGSDETNIPDIWINGVKQTLTLQGTPTATHTAADDSTAVLTIGNCDPTGGQTRYFDGIIDEVSLYSVILPDAEIINHYNLGVGIAQPSFNTTISATTTELSGLVWTTRDGFAKQSLVYTGTTKVKIDIPFITAEGGNVVRWAELQILNELGTRVYPSSCTSNIEYFTTQNCNNLSDNNLTTDWAGPEQSNKYIEFNFSSPIQFKGFLMQVDLDNSSTWMSGFTYSIWTGTAWIPVYTKSGLDWAWWIGQSDTYGDNIIQTFSGVEIQLDPNLFSDMDYVQDGVLTWLTGNNAGLSVEISHYNSTTGMATLFQPMPYPIGSADTFSITAGCNHLFLGSDGTTATGDCVSRYNNGVNFRGEPHVPTEDVLVGGIGETNKEPYQG